jgi:hypothetical protein
MEVVHGFFGLAALRASLTLVLVILEKQRDGVRRDGVGAPADERSVIRGRGLTF